MSTALKSNQSVFAKAGLGSLCLIIFSNLWLVFGVIYWRWDVAHLLTIYWIESGVIGLLYAVMLSRADRHGADNTAVLSTFIFTYGGALVVYAVFLWGLFDTGNIVTVLLSFGGLFWAAVLLLASHILGFIGQVTGAKQADGLPRKYPAIADPFPCLIVMFVAIVYGGIALKVLEAPVATVTLLALAKLTFDIGAHIRAHRAPFAPRERAAWAEAVLNPDRPLK